MRYRRIDLNLLVALEELLAQRNVTRAAAALNVTQSTMSGILNRLRECFDDPLLVPVGRRLQLTPLAESLIGPSHEAMQRIDALLDTQPVFDPATAKRHLVIATSDYVVGAFLADVLSEVAHEAPGLSFSIFQPMALSTAELDSGAVDLMITPAYLSSPNHPKATLFEDGYTVMAWDQNPLIGDSLSLAQYQSLGHVVFYAATGRPWFEQWYLTEYGDNRRVEMQVTGFHLMPTMVVGTHRIATVQTRLAHRLATSLPLRLLPLPMKMPPLTEVLQWSPLRQADPVHSWLRARLIAHASAV